MARFIGNKVIIMSPKPGIVKDIVKVELQLPRSRTSYDFEQIRSHVYKEFFGEDNIPEDYSV